MSFYKVTFKLSKECRFTTLLAKRIRNLCFQAFYIKFFRFDKGKQAKP